MTSGWYSPHAMMPQHGWTVLDTAGASHCCCSARTHSAGAVAAAQLEEPKPSMVPFALVYGSRGV